MITMSTPDWESLRHQMVVDQLQKRGIREPRVLAVMRQVPRHLFVPESQRARSYEDKALAIGSDQTISQPYMVAIMLQALDLKGDEHVLEIGAGSGYHAALLSHLAGYVDSIEIIPELAQGSRETLAELGVSNVAIYETDGTLGLPQKAPYDVIVVAAAAPDVPPPLLYQLAPNGKLLIPIGDRKQQILTLFTKQDSQVMRHPLGPCAFVPLRGQYGWPAL
jgi:protein-L-isoaspartate(D-aspartate) O-methyltransferase